MLPDVPVVVGALLVKIKHAGQLRNQRGKHLSVLIQKICSPLPSEEFQQFGINPFPGHLPQHRRTEANGLFRTLCGAEVPDRQKAKRPHDPKSIFRKSRDRIPDASKRPVFQILYSAKRIHHAGFRRPGHRVDREIPAAQIFLQTGHKRDAVRMAAVTVAAFSAIGGDFHRTASGQNRQRSVAKTGADDAFSREDCFCLRRQRGGAQIKILRHDAGQTVPDGASGHKNLKARCPEPLHNIQNIFRWCDFFFHLFVFFLRRFLFRGRCPCVRF